MKILLKGGLVYQCHMFAGKDVLLEGGSIRKTGENLDAGEAEAVDVTGRYVVPGLIDIHTHGAVGVDVNGAGAGDFEKVCRFQASQGTTSWQASILTDTREQTLNCIKEYNRWKAMKHQGADIMGLHLEGPFLCPEYKGAMPEHLLQKPNMALLQEYQAAARGDIRYITVSPEVEGIPDFIPEMKKLGMTVAIGHSGADYDTARLCIANGAMASTHTGNAMKLLHQHFPAIWGAVLEEDELYCEIICDGRHLHPGTVRLIIKTKGLGRVVAVTDSIMAAGLSDGEYKLGVNDVVVADSDAKLKSNGARAGSTLTTVKALQNLLAYTGKSLADILPLLTENPARLMGVYNRIGSIEAGKDGDLTVLDKGLCVVKTYTKGKLCS